MIEAKQNTIFLKNETPRTCNIEKLWNIAFKRLSKNYPPRVIEILKDFKFDKKIEIPLSSAFVFGIERTGKTMYMYQIATQLAKEIMVNYTPSYAQIEVVNSENFLQAQKDWMFSKVGKSPLQKYIDCDFLFLDDLLVKPISDCDYLILYNLIDTRFMYCKSTYYSSNNSLQQMANLVGDNRITGRIINHIQGNYYNFEHVYMA